MKPPIWLIMKIFFRNKWRETVRYWSMDTKAIWCWVLVGLVVAFAGAQLKLPGENLYIKNFCETFLWYVLSTFAILFLGFISLIFRGLIMWLWDNVDKAKREAQQVMDEKVKTQPR